MKKIFILIFIFSIWIGEVWSKKVEPDIVKKVALHTFNQKMRNHSLSSIFKLIFPGFIYLHFHF